MRLGSGPLENDEPCALQVVVDLRSSERREDIGGDPARLAIEAEAQRVGQHGRDVLRAWSRCRRR